MLKLFYAPTPPSLKIILFLEEAKIDYKKFPLNIYKKQNLLEEYKNLVPTTKVPALYENNNVIFESSNILLYLAQKYNKFLGEESNQAEVISWYFWGTADLIPKFVQHITEKVYDQNPNLEFLKKIEEQLYVLLDVLNKQLNNKDYVAGIYSIADINLYIIFKRYLLTNLIPDLLKNFPNIQKWLETMDSKPSSKKVLDLIDTFDKDADNTNEEIINFIKS